MNSSVQHYYQNESHQGVSQTKNLWHSRPQTYPLRYNVGAIRMANSTFYSNRIMRDG